MNGLICIMRKAAPGSSATRPPLSLMQIQTPPLVVLTGDCLKVTPADQVMDSPPARTESQSWGRDSFPLKHVIVTKDTVLCVAYFYQLSLPEIYTHIGTSRTTLEANSSRMHN